MNALQDHKFHTYIQFKKGILLVRSEEQQVQQPPQTSTSFR